MAWGWGALLGWFGSWEGLIARKRAPTKSLGLASV
jgi:hypothetical protein